MDTLTFTIYSNQFVPGEYVTKKEMEEHAYKNNYDLLYLDDRVRQKVSSKSCYNGNKSGKIYHTFIAVKGLEGVFQYLGELYEDAKVFIINSFIEPPTMLHVKFNAKIHTSRYIIKFSLQIETDFTHKIFVFVETEGYKDQQYLPALNVHVWYKQRRLFLKEESYIKDLICNVDDKINVDNDIETRYKLKIISDYLKKVESEIIKENEKFYFY